ncbi:MAG: alpha-galactosidase [Acidobacteriota bacterium]
MKTHLVAVLAILLACGLASPAHAEQRALLSRGTAVVSADIGDRSWTIGNDQITLVLGLEKDSSFAVRAIELPGTGRSWTFDPVADSLITVEGIQLPFGLTSAGWRYIDTLEEEYGAGLRLGFVYESSRENLRVIRWYASVSGTPTIEVWTDIQVLKDQPTDLTGINVWQMVLPPGDVEWLTGLKPREGTPGPFTVNRTTMGLADVIGFGSDGRSSTYNVPWFAVDWETDKFFAGLMWSGSWSAQIERRESGLRVTMGLPTTTTTVSGDRGVETPHMFLGVARGPEMDVAEALRGFVTAGVRFGRGFDPLVTYNTWYAYGVHIDEAIVLREMKKAAGLGVELFVVDAGWYPTGDVESWDFLPGLGTWTWDEARFPSGLPSLRRRAHELGMRFGLWVEPERIDIETLKVPDGAMERWLATEHGVYDLTTPREETRGAQICLVDPAAWQWVFDHLVALIDEVGPDYLKWDNNLWVNCDRPGHDHGTEDGNFRHVQAVYEMLTLLRERYPAMQIENCSGGGNRLDLGMARLTDTAWMDDQTTPAVRVRHNVGGLTSVFPPAYLLSFLIDDPSERMYGIEDLSALVRSRMPGVLGFSFRSDDLLEHLEGIVSSEIRSYKEFREVLRHGSTQLITAQAVPQLDGGWDAMQATSAVDGRVLLFAFQSDPAVDGTVIRPRGLDPDVAYAVSSVDDGEIGLAVGRDLMEHGLGVRDSRSSAVVIRLVPIPKK